MKNILEINNVTKFYKNSVKALENVNTEFILISK